MNSLILITLAIVLFLLIKYYLLSKKSTNNDISNKKQKIEYTYKHKDFLMTSSENDFSKLLFRRFSDEYRIYPQIHLSSIIDHQVKGQNWKAALSHIDRKSVDFVICDKEHSRPLCAIELDDWSHESAEAKDKDALKENLLSMSSLPLVRINNWRDKSEEEIYNSITAKLPTRNT